MYRARTVRPRSGRRAVSDTQEKVEGWDQQRIESATACLIGAGGIGGQVALSSGKLGVKEVHIVDPDYVDESNTNRQFFGASDVGRFKAHALAQNASKFSTLGTAFDGYPFYFGVFRDRFPDVKPDVVISGVDNNRCRHEVSLWARKLRIPHVAIGISREADAGYVFVEEPGAACLGCFLGESVMDQSRSPCPGTPAVVDVLQAVGGLATFVVTTLLTGRDRAFNLVRLFMATGNSEAAMVERNGLCPLCGNVRAEFDGMGSPAER